MFLELSKPRFLKADNETNHFEVPSKLLSVQTGLFPPRLSGLPAVYAKEEEAETLRIVLEDSISSVQVQLFFGVLESEDIIIRSAKILNLGADTITVEKAYSKNRIFLWLYIHGINSGVPHII